MKLRLFIFVVVFQLGFLHAEPQENAVAPPRTPEQEATMQTNKMRQELGLTAEQAQEVYEINLRHARERQVSNSRSEALKRVKHKEQELQRVLSPRQYDRLQEMRTDYPAGAIPIDASVNGRTRPVTNPQRIESGRVVVPRENYRSAQPVRRSGTNASGGRTPASQSTYRQREAIPAGNSENRRSAPEGTRYTPASPRDASPGQSSSPSRSETIRQGNSSPGSGSGSSSRSESGRSGGSSTSGTRR
ncbi:MAG: hypothetical protein LWW91_07015 [Bacteroidales bacterium]|nr:hypothetical protein [Bacteroidales bacterium]